MRMETREKLRVAYYESRGLSQPDEIPPIEADAADQAVERRQRSIHPAGSANARRTVLRLDARARLAEIAAGIFPGYACSIRRDGRWHAVILVNVAVHKYTRHESVARFATSDEAFDAARFWLKRKVEPR